MCFFNGKTKILKTDSHHFLGSSFTHEGKFPVITVIGSAECQNNRMSIEASKSQIIRKLQSDQILYSSVYIMSTISVYQYELYSSKRNSSLKSDNSLMLSQ